MPLTGLRTFTWKMRSMLPVTNLPCCSTPRAGMIPSSNCNTSPGHTKSFLRQAKTNVTLPGSICISSSRASCSSSSWQQASASKLSTVGTTGNPSARERGKSWSGARIKLTLPFSGAKIYPSELVGLDKRILRSPLDKSGATAYNLNSVARTLRTDEEGEDHDVKSVYQRRVWRTDHGRSGTSLWWPAPLAHGYLGDRNAAAGLPGAVGKAVARSGTPSGY